MPILKKILLGIVFYLNSASLFPIKYYKDLIQYENYIDKYVEMPELPKPSTEWKGKCFTVSKDSFMNDSSEIIGSAYELLIHQGIINPLRIELESRKLITEFFTKDGKLRTKLNDVEEKSKSDANDPRIRLFYRGTAFINKSFRSHEVLVVYGDNTSDYIHNDLVLINEINGRISAIIKVASYGCLDEDQTFLWSEYKKNIFIEKFQSVSFRFSSIYYVRFFLDNKGLVHVLKN